MKKKTLLILAVLITALACLFTSCSASVEPPKAEEEFGYVTFGNGGSRSLTTEYGIKNYDDLYWYYTAEKKDGFGLTGQSPKDENGNFIPQPVVATKDSQGNVTSVNKGLSGEVGPFSQGAWVFTLYAYDADSEGNKTDNLVYQGTSTTIVLKGGETKAVPVSVSLQGATGLVDLSRAYFQWKENATSSTGKINVTISLMGDTDAEGDAKLNTLTLLPNISLDEGQSNKYTLGSYLAIKLGEAPAITDIPAGYYTCTVRAYLGSDTAPSEATPVATQVMGLRVYGNATTYITGNLVESPNSYVDFTVPEQKMVAFNQNEARVALNPAGNTEDTVIYFGNNNLDADATHLLSVEVTDLEASGAKFEVTGDESSAQKTAVAGLSLTLNKIWVDNGITKQEEVTDFSSSDPVVITTYIAKGLEKVQVKYNGTGDAPIATDDASASDKSIAEVLNTDEGNSLGYNPATGLLRFKTTHFSEYYAVADKFEALNVTTNTAYKKFTDAFKGASSSNTIKLYDDIHLTSILEIKKSIKIDGDGHSIYNTANRVLTLREADIAVELYNLGIISECTDNYDVRGISIWDVSDNSSLLLDGCTVSASFYAINIIPGANNLNITIKNGTVAAGWAAINTYSNNSTFTIENSTLRGLNDKGESSWNDFATIVFDGNGLWNSNNIGNNGSNNTLKITDSTVYASSESSNNQAWLAIQYGARANNITLSNTNVIDAKGSLQIENITVVPFVGLDSNNNRYNKSYDVHSKITVDTEEINICYHGEIDYKAILDNGFHVPFEGCEDIEWSNVVTITPAKASTTTWNSDTLYYLAPGQYNDFSAYLHGKENVGFWALPNATFTKVVIGYHAGQDLSAKQNSTLTIKGFKVDGELMVNSADQKVVIEGNTAALITLKTHQFDDMNIQVINNTLTGGSDKASQKYGIYIVPNKTNYDLNISGNTFSNIYDHAIAVQGNGDGSAVTAANSIIVKDNKFESYGLNGSNGRAAFKIWEDKKYAPSNGGEINSDASSLIQNIHDNNTFSSSLGTNCVLGNFYGILVQFNNQGTN